MNPFSKGVSAQPKRGFRKGRNSVSNRNISHEKARQRRRHTRSLHKSSLLKESCGSIQKKTKLKCCMLNVNGLNDSTLADVKNVLATKCPDICILLETKRRFEDEGINLDIPGYEVSECRRSDLAGDKGGGGIAIYTRKADGTIFKDFDPDLPDPNQAFVRNERSWKTVETVHGKTAVCGVYAACQAADDGNGPWNDILFSVLRSEVTALRQEGFRVVLLGDFNAHIGNQAGIGIEGNKPDINRNGRRFLDFLAETNCVQVNGYQDLTTGLWTRQQGGISTILDYSVIAREHLPSVLSMFVDDHGLYGGSSDHNWMFLDLTDSIVKKCRISNLPSRKPSWNISHNQDWSCFQATVDKLVDETDTAVDAALLASRAAEILLESGKKNIGLHSNAAKTSMKATSLPPFLVQELQLKRQLEKNWKSKCSLFSNLPAPQRTNAWQQAVEEAETAYMEQRRKVESCFFKFKRSRRTKIMKKCSGNSHSSRKYFWSYVNKKNLKTSEIDAVVGDDGVLHCNLDEIVLQTEKHLVKVYDGSLDPIPVSVPPNDHSYASCSSPPRPPTDTSNDHPYSTSASPRLPPPDGSGSVQTDPGGWINRDFTLDEVICSVKTLKGGKAVGLDRIPNEFLMNAGAKFWELLVILYNKVKRSASFPPGWNKGRVALIHKRGPKELLGNYRPLTVIVSLSGLYSRLLNERLTCVVETHGLLGEVQNGFRKGRNGADNSFVLDTILWKMKALRKKVHMGFVDLTKAYDTVDRTILWKKLSAFGFGGDFLASLKAIYTGDAVQAVVNGVPTKPIYLRRGLRQGCSLSPMLFALYIADMGQAVTLSSEGFRVGNAMVSGLLFADDLVVVARDADGLLRLLSLVKKHADLLRMEINTGKDKSEVVSPDGAAGDLWQVLDDDGDVVLSLRQVVKYKYLGSTTMSSMHKVGLEKQKTCISKAHKYKGSCLYMSREGPDVVDMTVSTWCNIAIPSILFGTEMVPFSEATILEIERTQNQVARYALGVPSTTAGVCAQIELGLKPFRQVLYEHQLKYYARLLQLGDSRWAKQALLDHHSCTWNSPYISYIQDIRSKLGLYEMPLSTSRLLSSTKDHFIRQVNKSLASHSLPWILPISSLSRKIYVQESAYSSTLSKFRYNVAPIGNKYPRVGGDNVRRYCPVCPDNSANTPAHLSLFCPSVERIRKEQTSISLFRNFCISKGFTEDETFQLFINGSDWNKNPVEVGDYLQRGKDLTLLMESWLSLW